MTTVSPQHPPDVGLTPSAPLKMFSDNLEILMRFSLMLGVFLFSATSAVARRLDWEDGGSYSSGSGSWLSVLFFFLLFGGGALFFFYVARENFRDKNYKDAMWGFLLFLFLGYTILQGLSP